MPGKGAERRPCRRAVFVISISLAAVVAQASAGGAAASERPDRLSGRNWSPNGEWLGLNWPERDELFFISMKSGLSYMLRPAGNVEAEKGPVFTAQQAAPRDRRRYSKWLASPGFGKLTLLRWAPDSSAAAYRVDSKTLGVFAPQEERVTHVLRAPTPLPWVKPDALELSFELVAAEPDRPARYVMRLVRPGGEVVKTIAFTDPQQIRCVGATRHRGSSYLSFDRRFVLYPRVGPDGWRIVREPAQEDGQPQPLTEPTKQPPIHWRLSDDDQYLAVTDGVVLTVGKLDDWAQAKTIPLTHSSVTLDWSPDGRHLAYIEKTSLSVLSRESTQPVLITRSCSTRFWGWRGSRLYYRDSSKSPADLFYAEAESVNEPKQLVKARHWDHAPRDVTISPDGKQMACVVAEIDYRGRVVWQLWRIALQPAAEWELLYELRPASARLH